MSRFSRRETYSNGQYMYDDRYNSGEFDSYSQSTSCGRGPSSGEYYYDQAHCNDAPYTTSSSSSRRAYDAHGYPRESSYAGEKPLGRRLGRRLGRELYSYIDQPTYNEIGPRTRVGRDNRSEHGYGRRSGLSQQLSVEDRRQARREAIHLRRKQQRQHLRQSRSSTTTLEDYADGNPFVRSDRSGRGCAATVANDPYLASMQTMRGEHQAAYDDRPSPVRGFGRGWFPAYESR